ncbi:MAG: class I SAM-dependent rRNA methyltransferase [Myxococcota bacterium]
MTSGRTRLWIHSLAKDDLVEISLSPPAAASIRGGHPWLFRGSMPVVPAGRIVRLRAPEGDVVGWGLADEGAIAVRVLGRDEPRGVPGLLRDRITRADAVRVRLVGPNTDAYRVVSGPGDGLPGLVVDRYGGVAVLRLYASAWVPYLDDIVAVLKGLPWVESVFRRYGVGRVDERDGGETLVGPEVGDHLVVHEDGMALIARPHSGQKTGLFLDQREHRSLVGRWAAGRLVVNLFAYTGGFSVAAARGGAARVTTVDVAPEAIEDAKENFRLNGFDPAEHAFVVANVFDWTPQGPTDLLIVDPPSLAKAKRNEGAARSAYRKLHRRLGPWVVRDGLLATSSCTARLSMQAWAAAVEEGLRQGDWSWHWRSGGPPDHPVGAGHPEGHYLKFGLLRRR